MAFEKGNKLGAKGAAKRQERREWDAVLRRAALRNSAKGLNDAAEALLSQCAAGDVGAIKELGERIDGKVAQAIDANLSGDLTITIVRFADNAT